MELLRPVTKGALDDNDDGGTGIKCCKELHAVQVYNGLSHGERQMKEKRGDFCQNKKKQSVRENAKLNQFKNQLFYKLLGRCSSQQPFHSSV